MKFKIKAIIISLILFMAAGINSSNAEEVKKMTDNYKFENKTIWEKPSFYESLKMTWDFFFKGNDRVPEIELPYVKTDLSFLDSKEKGILSSWLAHSTILMNIDGFKIITDPVFERKATIFGPKRFNKDYPVDINKIKHLDAVIISHNHYDHLNKSSIKFLKNRADKFIVPIGVGRLLQKWGVDSDKIIEMRWNQEYNLSEKFSVISTPSRHFSGRGLFDSNETMWSSWVIKTDEHKVFFSGDSGYFSGFKQIGEAYGPFDVTFLECGAYDKRWHDIHMFPEETVMAHKDLRGRVLHPIHNSTFNLAMHPWYEPLERVTKAAAASNVRLITPLHGEIISYNSSAYTEMWWREYMPYKESSLALTQ